MKYSAHTASTMLSTPATAILATLLSVCGSDEFQSLTLHEKDEILYRLQQSAQLMSSNGGRGSQNSQAGAMPSRSDPCVALPFELVLKIFQHLGLPDIMAASLVCRRWHSIATDPAVWQHLYRAQGWSLNERFVAKLGAYLEEKACRNMLAVVEKLGLELPREALFTRNSERSKEWAELEAIGRKFKYPVVASYLAFETQQKYNSTVTAPARWRYCINWQYLYQKRAELEKQWERGYNWTTFYPSISATLVTAAQVRQIERDAAIQHHQQQLYAHLTLNAQAHLHNNNEVPGDAVATAATAAAAAGATVVAQIPQQVVGGVGPTMLPAVGLWMPGADQMPMAPMFIYAVQFDKNYIVSGSKDTSIKIWDLKRSSLIATLHGHKASVLCLQFNAEENIIVSGDLDGKMIIWDMKELKYVSIILANLGGVMDIAFNSNYIVSAGRDKVAHLWSRESPHLRIRTLRGHHGAINCLKLHGDSVITGSADKSVKLWDLNTGECLRTFTEHTRGVATVGFDGHTIVSGGSGRCIHFYNVTTGEVQYIEDAHAEIIRTLQYNSRRLVTGSHDGTIKCWEPSVDSGWSAKFVVTLAPYLPPHLRTSHVFNLQFDHRRILASVGHNTIICIDMGKAIEGMDLLDDIYDSSL
ncbi:WD40-repeat-containing domain protein [Limtongia smithiae]|uniref:WD40-repeat-containing domain protein n=1 Tax=Limtongia smithiae TaxID=1125753 RepID=UPI0034CD490B